MTNGYVYKIYFDGDDRMYIGSTTDFERRTNEHLVMLRTGRHKSKKLQNAYDKFGFIKMRSSIVEIVEDLIFLRAREQASINRNASKLYNSVLSAFAHDRTGEKMDADVRERISKSLQGNKYRSGISHTDDIKEQISNSLKEKYSSGLRIASVKIGTDNSQAKLDDNKVRDIRSSNESNKSLSEKYSVSIALIGLVKKRKVWKHVK